MSGKLWVFFLHNKHVLHGFICIEDYLDCVSTYPGRTTKIKNNTIEINVILSIHKFTDHTCVLYVFIYEN